MKVLVLSHMYPAPYNEVSGVFVHEQVRALKREGAEIEVVSPTPWTPFPINRMKTKWRNYDKVPEKRTKDGVEVYYPRYLTFPRKWFFSSSGTRMYRGIKDTIREVYDNFKFDLIHAHVALPDGYSGVQLADHYSKPSIVTIHGADAYETLDYNEACKEKIIRVFKKTEKVIPVSQKLSDVLAKKTDSWFKEKSKVIGNGIDINKVLNTAQEKQNNHRDTILSVGYLIPRKANKYVLKALKEIINTTRYDPIYKIIGKGPEKSNLESLVDRLNLKKNVQFLGLCPHEEVMQRMANADIFALPSWNEAFGVVYIEAMAHGKPVIACKEEGIDGIVKNGENGLLVEPKNVKQVFDAVKFLLDNPREAKQIGERARELIMENYTWNDNADKTIQVYEKVLG